MKKIIAFLFLVSAIHTYSQEGFKIGIHGSMPFDDFNSLVSLSAGAEVGYMWALGEVVDLGLNAGYIHGFPETFHSDVVITDLPAIQFLPLAASIRIWPNNSFSFGVDAGQALGINDGNDGGLYYRPMIGFLMGASTEINFSYTGIHVEGATWTTVNFGIVYTFLTDRFN